MLELAHIGYVVRDMDASLKRFCSEGCEVIISPGVDPVQKVQVCLLKMPGGVDIELVAPAGFEGCPVEARLRRGGGLDHLCYYTDDIARELEREQSAGAIVVCQPCHAVIFGRDIAFVHRRSGLVVEYMSR